MKYLFSLILLLSLAVSGVSLPYGDDPPFPVSLAYRVARATHVFVGVATRVRVVKKVDGEWRVMKPEPESTVSEVYAEIEIEVKEVLYPDSWKPSRKIKFLFGGGHFGLKDIRADVLGKQFIYLASMLGDNDRYLTPSYPWHLAEALSTKQEIEEILKNKATDNARPDKSVARLPSADLELRIELAVREFKGGNKEAFSKVDLTQPEAIQYLRKYVNDPDPDVRWYVAVNVRVHHTPEAMQILADLVRNRDGKFLPAALYSLEDNYRCQELVDARLKNVVPNLIASARDYFKGDLPSEIRLLGCLGGQDVEARKFLDESLEACKSGKLAFPKHLNTQCGLLNLALARSGSADAVANLHRELKASVERGRPDELEGWLYDVEYIDDNKLLSSLAELIKDKREGRALIPHFPEPRLRICDLAISLFTKKLGGAVTGEEEPPLGRHTDEELERIYRRVKLFLEGHPNSSRSPTMPNGI